VTKKGSPDFVPEGERIATFDNDGTLWAEQPMYFQLLFALDRLKTLAPEHAEWKDKEPFASLLKGDVKGALAGGANAILSIVVATHSGKRWLANGSSQTQKETFAIQRRVVVGQSLTAADHLPDRCCRVKAERSVRARPAYWRAIAMRIASSGETRWSEFSAASAMASWTPLTRPLKALPREL
jgi:hypothetical protein